MKKTFAFLFSTFLTGTLAAGNGKLAKDLEALDPALRVDVIVQFKAMPTERQHEKIKAKGGSYNKSLGTIKGALYSVPAGKLKDVGDDPACEGVVRHDEHQFGLNLASCKQLSKECDAGDG